MDSGKKEEQVRASPKNPAIRALVLVGKRYMSATYSKEITGITKHAVQSFTWDCWMRTPQHHNIWRQDPGCGNCTEWSPCKHGQSFLAKIPKEITDASGKWESVSQIVIYPDGEPTVSLQHLYKLLIKCHTGLGVQKRALGLICKQRYK